jgi:NAD(P)-dependent dehydrogenase (short-subunit alcohol dehydrogenase family)
MTTKITEIVDVEDLSRPTNSNEMTNFAPSLHHDTYPFITPTGSELVTKSIFITGASRGLGRATAIRCAKAGCAKIALAARGSLAGVVQEIEETVREAGIPPPQILPLQVDVTSDESVRAAAKAFDEAFGGKLDILVNNAGHFTKFKPIHEVDPTEWWASWEVNVKGTFLSCHYFIPLLLKADTKIVINLPSMAANCLTYGASAYQVSRFSNCRSPNLLLGTMSVRISSVSLCTLGV